MLFINQNDYPDVRYPTNAQDPQSSSYLNGTIASSGCGLCSLCMLVDQLTLQKLDLLDCRDLAIEHKANMKVGTRMAILGPVVADMYGLTYDTTDDESEMLECLKNGGKVIVNVGGNHDDHTGIFCYVGHYILAIGYQDGYVRILDPDYKKEKYDKQEIRDKVIDFGKILYARPEVLHEDTLNRSPGYYLFNKRGL
ncbi:MAG: hypothetical protein IJM15_09060 [Erysipelotrichaceae bacterium]|nr:hypothetical protein [Erysipelotrichaceae bacterium]